MTDILFTANGASATVQVNGELTSGMVGVPVRFAFDSDWDGLNIVVVFDGSGRRISVPLLTEYQGVLPWEVIAKANTRLHIGAEGRKSDGSIVIPTVWANAGYIREGAAATDDEGNPPTPSIYDQIMAAIEAGKLQGKPGEDGVSPTVSVTEIEGGHRVTITDENGKQVFDVMDGKDAIVNIVDNLGSSDPNAALSARMGGVLKTKIEDDVSALGTQLQRQINQRVKTVNGVSPDANGNVVVQGGGSGGASVYVQDEEPSDAPVGTLWYDTDEESSGGGGSGEPGADGFSPIANVTQTDSGAVITVTDKSGTSTATVFNGKTPKKGVDYFTDAEITEIAEYAAELVEVPEGGGGGTGGSSEMTELFRLTTTEEVGRIETGINLNEYAEVVAFCDTIPIDGTSSATHFDWYVSKSMGLRINNSLHQTQRRMHMAHITKLSENKMHAIIAYGTGGNIFATGLNESSGDNLKTFANFNGGYIIDNVSKNFAFGSYGGNTMLKTGTRVIVYGRK